MILKTLLAVLLVAGIHCSKPLPFYMEGNFILETSDGFNDYMYEIGVSYLTRKVTRSTFSLPSLNVILS